MASDAGIDAMLGISEWDTLPTGGVSPAVVVLSSRSIPSSVTEGRRRALSARRAYSSLLAVDRDALGPALRAFGLRHGDRQHPVLEACLHLVLLDLGAERDAALELAIEALAELAPLVFGFRALLAAQGEDVIVQR